MEITQAPRNPPSQYSTPSARPQGGTLSLAGRALSEHSELVRPSMPCVRPIQ